ncbi:MAG: DUF2309 domain-containing protein [Polyangiaceae bacterium]
MKSVRRQAADGGDALELLRLAARRIAPAWPLDRFVAVNPYHGLTDLDFVTAATMLEKVGGARSTSSTDTFRAWFAEGKLTGGDLDQAIADRGSALTRDEVLEMLASGELEASDQVRTVADVVDLVRGEAWGRFSRDHLAAWLASYHDEHYAMWQPSRQASLYATWRAEAEIDRTPEIMGARGFRGVLRALPSSAEDAAREAMARLRVPQMGGELYLHRLLLSVGGWSAYAAGVEWDRRLRGERREEPLVELLAVLTSFELALYESLADEALRSEWRRACKSLSSHAKASGVDRSVEARVLLQTARERGFQRELAEALGRTQGTRSRASSGRARRRAQAVFCIDVRSEVFRRHLEVVDGGVDTIGFAGFFGFPLEVLPLGHERGSARCPALLAPTHRVAESVAPPHDAHASVERRVSKHLVRRAWQSFKMGAISCFSFVGPVGLAYLPKLLGDSFGFSRPVPDPAIDALGAAGHHRTIDLDHDPQRPEVSGIAPSDRIDLAAAALAGMGLTKELSRIVLLVGHGSTSVNNPHASGLDCGACGGHSGEANARVAASVLNDPAVREGLRGRGIDIPDDTLFVGALHDTTTDVVTILDRHRVPASHGAELERLASSLETAGEACRRERAQRAALSVGGDAWFRRSRDWAEVRPEWGLAGCAAFIAAPRHRTAGLDLGGRAFLHSYVWDRDEDAGVLELIMTAPLIVASWINLQYYASSVDPALFGAGNKTLHNVVGGTVGVLEGNTGDLRIGLPWQSVCDGERLVHEPLRLTALIEAPPAAMNAVIERHENLRQLLDNGWIRLFAIDSLGQVGQEYVGGLEWRDLRVGMRGLGPAPQALLRAS